MADIRLISILPSPGVQPSPVSQGAAQKTPTLLPGLPPGSILSGFIINRDPAGNPVLRTDSGDVTFQTSFFLRIGSEVVIRLENRAGSQQAHILSVNGQPPEVAAAQSSFADEPEVIVSGSIPRGNDAAPSPRQQQPPPAAAPPTPETEELAFTPRTTLIGTLLSPPPNSTLPAGAKVIFSVINISAGAPATPASPAPSYPTSTPPPVPPQLIPGQQVSALVIGKEPSGETLAQLPQGIIRLQTPLPPGSRVTLEVISISQPPVPANVSLQPAPITEIATQWTSLQQIASLLPPPLTQKTPHNDTLPWLPDVTPPPPVATGGKTAATRTIGAGLLFFLSALKGGTFGEWLGQDNVRHLQSSGHEALLKRAEAEFMAMSRPFSEVAAAAPQPQTWQTLVFPFLAAGQWQQARIFVKRDRDASKQQRRGSEEDTRFIVEVSLSQLGDLQLDGFVRHQQKSMEFDLVVRSRLPLIKEDEQAILRIYNEMGELTGYRGGLTFQAVRQFPVRPLEEIAQATGGVLA